MEVIGSLLHPTNSTRSSVNGFSLIFVMEPWPIDHILCYHGSSLTLASNDLPVKF